MEGVQKPLKNMHKAPKKIKKLSSEKDLETQDQHVNNLFNKRFIIKNIESYSLPEVKVMFVDDPWKIDKLQVLKDELNKVKSSLNNCIPGIWQSFTNFRNSAKDVMKRVKYDANPEFVTQAWCKFYQLVSSFPLVPVDNIKNCNNGFKSIHLCEAPGAFVTSLNHWLVQNQPGINWNWIATSLNPYYEGNSVSVMIEDDRFIRHTLTNWWFGEDYSGDIMKLENLDELIKVSMPSDNIFLITADGSIDCMDLPGEQESIVAHLQYCETVSALSLLTAGGSFLLKIFTIFEHHSVCLLYLLSCCFETVTVVKPVASKEGNSECYVICTQFVGSTFISPYLQKLREHYDSGSENAMFRMEDIPDTFIHQMIRCAEFFKSHQCQIIKENLSRFKTQQYNLTKNIKLIQWKVADRFMKEFQLRKLQHGSIIEENLLRASKCINTIKIAPVESYEDRCKEIHLSDLERLKKYFNEMHKIEVDLTSFRCNKTAEFPKNLKICSGKPFHKIRSSRFCLSRIMKLYNNVIDLIRNIQPEIQFPSKEYLDHEQFSETSEHKVVIFRYTDPYDSHVIMSTLLFALQELKMGDNLALIGYSLLTHLNIGLLYLIHCSFEKIEIQLNHEGGSKILLRHCKQNLAVIDHLIRIRNYSFELQQKGKAVLEILPAKLLYDYVFYYPIVQANFWIIQSFVRYLIDKLEHR